MADELVLVADDSPLIVDLLASTLEGGGFRVNRASDGAQASALLDRESHALLFLDIHMPRVNGIELVRQMRSRGDTTPVVMISGMATGITKDRAIRLGSVVYVEKPFDVARMLTLTRELIEASRQPAPRHKSILVVDDHPETLELLRTVLGAVGYEITSVSDGASALRRLKEAVPPFDMAMVDLVMPGMAGSDVVAEIRKTSPETLPLLMTGEAGPDDIRTGYEKGGYTLIRKPFDVDVLLHFLAVTERQCEDRQQELAEKEHAARQPLPVRVQRKIAEIAAAPSSSREKRVLKTILIVLASMVLGILVLWAASSIETAVTGRVSMIGSFMDRVEGYLQRDEEREVQRGK